MCGVIAKVEKSTKRGSRIGYRKRIRLISARAPLAEGASTPMSRT